MDHTPNEETTVFSTVMNLIFDNETSQGKNVTNSTVATPCSYQSFDIAVYAVIICLLCCFGLVGNTLSIIVLRKENRNKSAILLLQALALSDNTMLMTSFVVSVLIQGIFPFLLSDNDNYIIRIYAYKYINPLWSMSQTAVVWTTLLLAFNRYIAVCRPFLGRRKWLKVRVTRLEIVSTVLLAIALNMPRIFQVSITHGDENKGVTLADTAIGGRSLFAKVYINMFSVMVLVVPMLFLIIFNVKLISELRSVRQRRPPPTTSQPDVDSDHNITIVMIIIIVTFIVCHTPDGVVSLSITYGLISRQYCSPAYYYSYGLCNLLMALNSSVNFVIYYLFRKSFRRVLAAQVCAPFVAGRKWFTEQVNWEEMVPHRPSQDQDQDLISGSNCDKSL